MERKLKRVSKLLAITGCVSILAAVAGTAAPLTYDMQQPNVRTDYVSNDKIRLEGDVSLGAASNQKITLSLRNTDVQQVLRMFADKAGLNIVFHESAKGTVTLDLVNVNLDEAFKLVMKMSNLTYVIKDKTMMVVATGSAENLNLTKDSITVIPVKYADAGNVAHFLNTNIFSMNTPGLSYGPIVTTNSDKNELLIFGTDNDVMMAKKIVDKLDKKPVLTTYRVNHTTPFEMAKMICETLFQLPVDGKSGGDNNGGANYNTSFKMQTSLNKAPDGAIGGGTTVCSLSSGISTKNISSFQTKPALSIYVQPELGTLTMVGGSEHQIQMVNDFIMLNDRKQPQALLEISIVELSESGQKEFNNSWAYNGKHLNIGFTNGTTATNSPIIWHGPNNSHGAHTLTQTISYLISNGKARILSNPKIIITNGKKSTIDLTQDYIKETTVQFVSAGTSTQGAEQMYAQRTYETGDDNGIKITVLPFISPDGYVSLNIKPEYASILETIQDTMGGVSYTAATLLERHNLDLSNVRIKDEETLVLGGFLKNFEEEKVQKIPLLGDIPVLGFFFKSQQKKLEKRELLFVITPRIIKDTEDVVQNL